MLTSLYVCVWCSKSFYVFTFVGAFCLLYSLNLIPVICLQNPQTYQTLFSIKPHCSFLLLVYLFIHMRVLARSLELFPRILRLSASNFAFNFIVVARITVEFFLWGAKLLFIVSQLCRSTRAYVFVCVHHNIVIISCNNQWVCVCVWREPKYMMNFSLFFSVFFIFFVKFTYFIYKIHAQLK